MKVNRKTFLKQASFLGSSVALPTLGLNSFGATKRDFEDNKISNPIGTSTYSFWHFEGDKKNARIENCIENASRMGFHGIEILLVQMQATGSIDNAYINKLKRLALHAGLSLYGMSTHQQFFPVKKEDREYEIEKTKSQIELAYKLGIPQIRIQTGTWGTRGSFDNLMKFKGYEEPPEGYTNEDGFKWAIDGINKCIPKARECGVTLALENHWGLGRKAEWLMRIFKAVDSPWLGFTADTGNFFPEDDRYEQLKTLAPHTVLIQAKTYYGGGLWYDNPAEFKKVAKIFHDADYRGWVSLEFEGKEDAMVAVPKSLRVLREAFS